MLFVLVCFTTSIIGRGGGVSTWPEAVRTWPKAVETWRNGSLVHETPPAFMTGPPRRPIPLAIILPVPGSSPIRVAIFPHPIVNVGVPPHPDLPRVVEPPVVALSSQPFLLFVEQRPGHLPLAVVHPAYLRLARVQPG